MLTKQMKQMLVVFLAMLGMSQSAMAADFKDFSVIVNNQDGTLLTAEEQKTYLCVVTAEIITLARYGYVGVDPLSLVFHTFVVAGRLNTIEPLVVHVRDDIRVDILLTVDACRVTGAETHATVVGSSLVGLRCTVGTFSCKVDSHGALLVVRHPSDL